MLDTSFSSPVPVQECSDNAAHAGVPTMTETHKHRFRASQDLTKQAAKVLRLSLLMLRIGFRGVTFCELAEAFR
jgi:hypothetical protein